MSVVFTNSASSRLASSLTSSATSLSVTTGEGAKFPIPSGGTWFPVTVLKSSGALEIMKCTARSGDVLTVTRAQEGTAAQTFSAGDRVELRLTVAAVQQFLQTDTITTFMQQMLANDADAAAVRSRLQLGSAALKPAQSSASDVTSGAVLINGAYGLPLDSNYLALPFVAAGVDSTTDWNSITSQGWWGKVLGTGNANNPGGGTGFWYCLVLKYPAGNVTQVAFPYGISGNSGTIKWRTLYSGVWSAWREIFHSGNVSAFVQTLFDDADADTFLATLGFSTFMRGMRDDADAPTARATLGAISSADVPSAVAGQAVGTVGSYAFCKSTTGSAIAAGGTVAGSSLLYSSVAYDSAAGAPTGTWRCMGMTPASATTAASLFLRIA